MGEWRPELESLALIRWQLFAGLSFRRERMSDSEIQRMSFAWLRELAAYFGVHFEKLLWCLRLENGESTGRRHLHALISGAPPYRITERACRATETIWFVVGHGDWANPKKGPHSVVRVFDPCLSGADYILKGLEQAEASWRVRAASLEGANVYEFQKFGYSGEVTLSKSVVRVVTRARTARTLLTPPGKAAQACDPVSPIRRVMVVG